MEFFLSWDVQKLLMIIEFILHVTNEAFFPFWFSGLFAHSVNFCSYFITTFKNSQCFAT